MRGRQFVESMIVITRRDLVAHFGSLSNNVFLFIYFITGAVLWAVTLSRLVSLNNYFQFLLIGLMVLGIYNTSYNYMNIVSTEVRRGYMKYFLALPLSRGGFSFGRVAAGTLQGLVYVAILFIFSVLLMGLPPAQGILTIFVSVASIAFCLSSLGIAIATHFRPDMIDPVSDILGLSLIFTSTLYYPAGLMPDTMRIVSSVNVLSAGGNLMRAAVGVGEASLQDIIIMIVWDLIFGILSIRGYYRRMITLE